MLMDTRREFFVFPREAFSYGFLEFLAFIIVFPGGVFYSFLI